MSPQRVLVTGASGCVGTYVARRLIAADHDLVIVARHPGKLAKEVADSPGVTIIESDIADVDDYRARIGAVDAAVLLAAGWGGANARRVNLDANLALTRALTDGGCRRILYFGTASVLDSAGRMLPAAGELGSDYIRSKYELVEAIEGAATEIDLVGLFPTLILGGDASAPLSHFARLLREAAPRAGLLRFFRTDGRFHIIHAEDIARIVEKLLAAPLPATPRARRIVLGNPALGVNEAIEQFCAYLGKPVLFRFPVRTWMAEAVIRAFRIRLSPWDRHCMENRDLSHAAPVHPATMGLPAFCPDLATGLASIGIKRGS